MRSNSELADALLDLEAYLHRNRILGSDVAVVREAAERLRSLEELLGRIRDARRSLDRTLSELSDERLVRENERHRVRNIEATLRSRIATPESRP